jgi:hypothetical protein
MNITENYAQPANSGILQKVQAELLVPDPDKTIAMEIINDSTKSNTGADGDHRKGSQQDGA